MATTTTHVPAPDLTTTHPYTFADISLTAPPIFHFKTPSKGLRGAKTGSRVVAQSNVSLIFQKLPFEIRLEIYKWLLVNPVLGQSLSWFGPGGSLGLCPNILRTCHQIYVEASYVLYNFNKFFYCCFSEDYGYAITPFARNRSWHVSEVNPIFARTYPVVENFMKVRKWKVPIGLGRFHHNQVQSWDHSCKRQKLTSQLRFNDFCQIISKACPTSIEIEIVPRASEHAGYHSGSDQTIEDVLQPLKILHHIQDLRIRHPALIASTITYDPKWDHKYIKGVRGDAREENGLEIYERLLRYVQAFERYTPHKKLLEVDSSMAGKRQAMRELKLKLADLFPNKRLEASKSFVRMAQLGVVCHNIAEIKSAREKAVSKLEQQLQRIFKAHKGMLEFVKKEKRQNGFLDVTRPCDFSNTSQLLRNSFLEKSLDHLERYANSFFPTTTKSQKLLDVDQPMTSREMTISKVPLDIGQQDYKAFHTHFRKAIDDMNRQCVEIYEARKQLLGADHVPDRYHMDLETSGLFEMIDWSVNEPDIEANS